MEQRSAIPRTLGRAARLRACAALLPLVALACVEPDPADDDACEETRALRAQVIVQQDVPTAAPQPAQRVIPLSSTTGAILPPPARETLSAATTGELDLTQLGADARPSLYVVGSGSSDADTLDTIYLQFSQERDPRLRVPMLASVGRMLATLGVMDAPDRAALTGAIYWSPHGERNTPIGCAKIYLDTNTTGRDERAAQFYLGWFGPLTSPQQNVTASQGLFYFGNLTRGAHRLRVSVDEGRTFVADAQIMISHTRSQAIGPVKALLYVLALDVDTERDPTPQACGNAF